MSPGTRYAGTKGHGVIDSLGDPLYTRLSDHGLQLGKLDSRGSIPKARPRDGQVVEGRLPNHTKVFGFVHPTQDECEPHFLGEDVEAQHLLQAYAAESALLRGKRGTNSDHRSFCALLRGKSGKPRESTRRWPPPVPDC